MGIILATIVSLILKIYPIRLPDAYYVSYLPIEMNWHIVLLVVIITFIISFIASWFPAQRVKSINIIEVLKGDII